MEQSQENNTEKTKSQQSEPNKLTLGKIVSYILGVLAAIAGVTYIFTAPLTGLLFIILALVALPPVNDWVAKKYNFAISGVLKFVVVLVLLGVIGATMPEDLQNSVAEDMNSSSTGNQQSEQQEEQVYEVGDRVQLGDSVVTVQDVEFSNGGQFSQPSSDNQYLNLLLSIENTSDSQQYITTMGQMFVRDDQGNSYQVAVTDRTVSSVNKSLDGTVIANSKRSGIVGFEIPADATGLTFQYNGNVWGGGSIKIDLGR